MSRDDIAVTRLEWDQQNVQHIALHNIEPEDIEFVLANQPAFYLNLPGRSATHVMVGRDERDRVLYVPILCVEWPDKWRAVTAWESRFARRLIGGEDRGK